MEGGGGIKWTPFHLKTEMSDLLPLGRFTSGGGVGWWGGYF